MSRRRKNLGDWGEQKACEFLQRHGFTVVERNYYTTVGEIDVIARKGDDYYFVEVKTRKKGHFSNDTSITYQKQQKLAKSVKKYCYCRNITDCSIILAGLIVAVDKFKKSINCRFCVLY